MKIDNTCTDYNFFIGLASDETATNTQCYLFFDINNNDAYALSSNGDGWVRGKHDGAKFDSQLKKNDIIKLIIFNNNLIYKMDDIELCRYTHFQKDRYKLAVAMYNGPHSISLLELTTEYIINQ